MTPAEYCASPDIKSKHPLCGLHSIQPLEDPQFHLVPRPQGAGGRKLQWSALGDAVKSAAGTVAGGLEGAGQAIHQEVSAHQHPRTHTQTLSLSHTHSFCLSHSLTFSLSHLLSLSLGPHGEVSVHAAWMVQLSARPPPSLPLALLAC